MSWLAVEPYLYLYVCAARFRVAELENSIKHLSNSAVLRCPGTPDASAPIQQFLVAARSRRDGQNVGHRQRPDLLRLVESGRLFRLTGHQHVHLLDLTAGETAFDRQVEASQRECRPDRGFRLANVLSPSGGDRVWGYKPGSA